MSDVRVRTDGLLPLVILGGFLGAGKSTWLRHQLFLRRFGKTHVLVNEAAEIPVDDALLGGAERLDVLAGGCACCQGRDDLLAALRRICDAASSTEVWRPDTIVLETSGIADPAAIARAIMGDPVLVRRITVSRIIVLVDAPEAANQLAAESLARAQVEAADEIIVTKVTETDSPALSRLAATLCQLAPGARLSWADFGAEIQVSPDLQALPFDLSALPEQGEPIRAYRLDAKAAGGWWALSAWLSAVLFARGDSIVRVKGMIRTPSGHLLLQSVRRHVQPPEILPDNVPAAQGRADFIVLIGRGITEDSLQSSWNRFVLGAEATGHDR